MNFNPNTHIIGKVYYLTQENMQKMLEHIDEQNRMIRRVIVPTLKWYRANTMVSDRANFALQVITGEEEP